jgi:putative tricarboxylic transport membrane protein
LIAEGCPMLTKDRLGALLLLAFSAGYGALTFEIPLLPFQAQAAFTARTMPEALSVLGILLALLLLLRPGGDQMPAVGGYRWGRAALICLLMVAYGLTMRPGGFLIATSLFLIGGMAVLGERRVPVLFGASVPIVVFFWALMTQVLAVHIEPWPAFGG